jgi:hypothetical protein
MSIRGDQGQIESIELPKTLMLVNNFILVTTEFLNNLSEMCDRKLAKVSTKIGQLEVLASVLETKLDSIPEDSLKGVVPTKASSSISAGSSSSSTSAPPPPPPSPGGAPPPPPPSGAPVEQDGIAPEAEIEAPAEALPGVAAKDHPDYAQFFKLQRLRVPQPVLAGKMEAAGLDPSVLQDPERRIVD